MKYLFAFLLFFVCAYGQTCRQCNQTVTRIETMMTNSTVQMNIASYLNQTLCSGLTGLDLSICTQIMVVDIPIIMEHTVRHFPPQKVCKLLHLC